MAGEESMLCKHPGSPPDEVVDLVVQTVQDVAKNVDFLRKNGLTPEEFNTALPAAIQRLRGRTSAENSDRRSFLKNMFEELKNQGKIADYHAPVYGADTVYRIECLEGPQVAIIQKGCPDGAHSSTLWSRPQWADEAYLWWVCDSMQLSPGEHVNKGVGRLRNKFFDNSEADQIDGIIFSSPSCGTVERPCPKQKCETIIGARLVPPPCIWIMPDRCNLDASAPFNWNEDGAKKMKFPGVLLSIFPGAQENPAAYTGYVGFKLGNRGKSHSIVTRSGNLPVAKFRSNAK